VDPAPLEAIGEINPAIYSTGFDLPPVDRQDSFDDRFGTWGSSSSGVAPPSAPGLPGQPSNRFGSWGTAPVDNSDNPRSPVLRELEKYRRAAALNKVPPDVGANSLPGKSGTSVFDTGAPAVPLVPPNNPLSPAPPTSFDDRFGNWGAPAPASAAAGAPQPTSSLQPGGTKPLDPKDIRILARVSPSGDIIFPPTSTPSTQAPPQPARPVGLVNGEPMPRYPVPPMLFGFSDRSATSGDNMDDWFTRWIKPLMDQ
jgi:hypothetical protein